MNVAYHKACGDLVEWWWGFDHYDIVDRLINRYTNEGELVFDPFGGIGTVPLRALKAGRRGLMTELNEGYFRDTVGYLDAEEEKIETPTLFDLMDGQDRSAG